MSKYFKQNRRLRHEGMNEYTTRKAEVYARACQTLDRVQRRYAPTTASRSQGSVVEPAAGSTASHAGAEEAEPDDAAYYDADEPEEQEEEDDQWHDPGHGGNQGIGHTVDGTGAVGPTMIETMEVPQ